MSYSEAKDLMILEGDGRSDAELFRQENSGTRAGEAGGPANLVLAQAPSGGKLRAPSHCKSSRLGPGKR